MADIKRIVAEHRRAVWLIAGALILNAALLALVVLPLSQKVRGGEQQSQGAMAELTNARRDFNAARATVTGKGQADSELKKFYQQVLPTDQSGARRILYLSIDQLARKSNLTVVRYNFDPATDRRSSLHKLTMTLNLEGEYNNIRRFIHQLETSPEFRVLESVALAQGEEGERGLSVTALVSTYFRTGGNGN
jgi:Tfp pilus assembly protein PilO